MRSQDKTILLKVETIKVVNNWFYLNNKYDMGFYKTKERALEVLDEIQNHIQKQGKMELDNEGGLKYYGKVYEMPEN